MLKGEKEISQRFEEIINKKKQEINDIQRETIKNQEEKNNETEIKGENQEEKNNETEIKVENKERKLDIKKIDDSDPFNFHANKNVVNNFIIKQHEPKGQLKSKVKNKRYRKQKHGQQNVIGTKHLNETIKDNARY